MIGEMSKKVTFRTGAVASRPADFRLPGDAEAESGPAMDFWKIGAMGLSMVAGGTASAAALPASPFTTWEPRSGSTELVELGASVTSSDYQRLEKRLIQLEASTNAAYRSLSVQLAALADRSPSPAPETSEESASMALAAAARIAELGSTDLLFEQEDWAEILDAVADAQMGDGLVVRAAARAIKSSQPVVRAAAARVLANGGGADAADSIESALRVESNPYARKVMESAARSARL
jgi:hypothetical protein